MATVTVLPPCHTLSRLVLPGPLALNPDLCFISWNHFCLDGPSPLEQLAINQRLISKGNITFIRDSLHRLQQTDGTSLPNTYFYLIFFRNDDVIFKNNAVSHPSSPNDQKFDCPG
jgi:hypothetical protein